MIIDQLAAHREAITRWFEEQWRTTHPPIYGSTDLRNAGYKLAPVDMNLYPAGFNNLSTPLINLQHNPFAAIADTAKQVLILPESHSRNQFYFAHLQALKQLLEHNGFSVTIGHLLESSTPFSVTLDTGETLTLYPIDRVNQQLQCNGITADVILLNNDCSTGTPELLQHIQQPITPPPTLGWAYRLKSNHANYYHHCAEQLAQLCSMDPWHIQPLYSCCPAVDFQSDAGLDCLIQQTDWLLERIAQKYREHHITDRPFIVLKSDQGTYGMAVMTIFSGNDLKTLNRKQRKKMATRKGGMPVSRAFIQEGIYSQDRTSNQHMAEPVLYFCGAQCLGGFYRAHETRHGHESLNTPGMTFHPFTQAMHTETAFAQAAIAQLAMLAASHEIQAAQEAGACL